VPGEIEERLDGASGTAQRHEQREWRQVNQEESTQSAEYGNRDPSTGWSQCRMLVEDSNRGTQIAFHLIERFCEFREGSGREVACSLMREDAAPKFNEPFRERLN
jgi:hypothetical protein